MLNSRSMFDDYGQAICASGMFMFMNQSLGSLRKVFLTTKDTKFAQSSQRKQIVLQRFVFFVNFLCVLCGKVF